MSRYIVVTNDDGIEAKGLKALVKALAPLAHLFVIAPDRERSASSHSLTLHKPLRVVAKQWAGRKVYAVNGTPSDCVFLALKSLCQGKIDLVVSGINAGANLGKDVTYSGTVSAAMESVVLGVPALAVSIASATIRSFSATAKISCSVAHWLMAHPLSQGTFLNVNVPALPLQKIKGVKVVHQSDIAYEGRLEKRTDLRGVPYYWIGGKRDQRKASQETDVWAIRQGYVSVTPLHLDLTDLYSLSYLKEDSSIEKITF